MLLFQEFYDGETVAIYNPTPDDLAQRTHPVNGVVKSRFVLTNENSAQAPEWVRTFCKEIHGVTVSEYLSSFNS